jgi:NitT/TauT family transport system substrate-binding protein
MVVRNMLAAAGTVAAAAALAAGCGSSNSSDSPSPSSSSSGKTTTVKLMVGGLDKQIYLPAMLAQRLGYYKEQGLNVELSDEPAGVEAANQLLASKVDGVVGFYDHTLDLQGKGRYTQSVVQMLRLPGEAVMCRGDVASQVKSPADWSGRKLGVTGLGSSTYFLTQYLATANGVDKSKITPVAVKAGPTFVAAMKQKAIDCGMTTEPTITAVQEKGLGNPLIDMRNEAGTKQALGGVYPASALYMRNDWVASHAQTVQKLANAYVKTLHWIQSHSAAQITDKMPAGYYAGVGKAQYVKALDAQKAIFSPDGVMPKGGPETVLKVLDSFDPSVKGKNIDLAKTYTTQFVDKANAALGSGA